MARIFKKNQAQEEADIDLTPMLDVVFIMLILFIVTATFVSESGFRVNSPPSNPGSNQEIGTTFVVTEANTIWIDGRQIDMRSVRAHIERAAAEKPETSITVRAHELSTADVYVGISDQAMQALGGNQNSAVNLVTYRD